MKVFTFQQKSPEWWAIRRGLPTASEFHRIITPKTHKPSAAQSEFINELIAEVVDHEYSQQPDQLYTSVAMELGTINEPACRSWYEFTTGSQVDEVGFCLSECGRFGCSPDGLVGDDGLLEIKCPSLKTHVGYLRAGELPAEYACQVHGALIATGRKWVDFVSFSQSEDIKSLIVRVYPSSFTDALRKELMAFLDRYDAELVRLGQQPVRAS